MFSTFSLNLRGRLVEYDRPQVMAILNATPDSFYAASRSLSTDEIKARARQLIAQGADIIDVGGYSSRPGAQEVSVDEETERVVRAVRAVREVAGDATPLSVDTFRASVAAEAVAAGADIVNDISAGRLDPAMLPTVASLKVPYIMMHMRGNPQTMSLAENTDYSAYDNNVVAGVVAELSERVHAAAALGIADIIVDPGFGFAKTTEQNFQLLGELSYIVRMLERPVLVGLSRKSMIWRTLGVTPQEALCGTIALDTVALLEGASILRVHDPLEARQTITLIKEKR